MIKFIVAALVVVLLFLQYELWFAPGGVLSAWHMRHSLILQQQANKKLKDQNAALIADIKQLKNGNQAVEERARSELGMVKKGEVFYQVAQP